MELARIDMPPVCVACSGEYLLSDGDLESAEVKDARTVTRRRRNELHAREAANIRASAISLRWKQQMQSGCQKSDKQLFPIVRG